MFKKKYLWPLIILTIFSILLLNIQMAGADEEPEEGDEEVFVSVAPDVLIVLDVSYSMKASAFGSIFTSNSNCNPDYTNCSGTGCSGGYCTSSKVNCNQWCYPNMGTSTDCTPDTTACSGNGCVDGFCVNGITGVCDAKCSRVEIAKRALFKILDDTGNNVIDKNDSASLNVRVGFMTFSQDSAPLRQIISVLGSTDMGTPYQTTYCGASKTGSCTPSSAGSSSNIAGQPNNLASSTPLVRALSEAKTYLDTHKAADTRANTCRQKFVILISDGADTKSCSGDGDECQDHMYKRRRNSVAVAKQLSDAGYRVYVIGFGANMPDILKNTLNWMAYYGGTDSPDVNDDSNIAGYTITTGCDPDGTAEQKALCCDLSDTDLDDNCFPAGITSCMDQASDTEADATYCSKTTFKATANDPGYVSLSGYAFMTADTTALVNALKTAIYEIAGQSYAFSKSSVQTIRLEDESYLYEGSFTPIVGTITDSFWPGSLKRYTITDSKTGALSETADWNAADEFPAADDRKVYTLKSGAVTAFNTTNISVTDLEITGGTAAQRTARRDAIVAYIRGGEQSGANAGKKLGDIFHSEPMTVGTPNVFAYDKIDTTRTLFKTKSGFDTYRSNNVRTTANELRLIMAGTNNAQFHVFKAANADKDGGKEIWSFIPPNFLPRLNDIAHSTHPTSCQHTYFFDGSTAGSDVWWGTDQTDKSASEWHTMIVLSEGRGGFTNLWSSSASCDSGFSDTYTATYSKHCGYYAFDVTDTTQTTPTFKWKLGGSSGLSETHGTHLAQPWSKMNIKRVLYDGEEKWVGFIGGGFTKAECTENKCDVSERPGKGFFVVDTQTGAILWSMTRSGGDDADEDTDLTSTLMNYGLAGEPATLDFDNDGFVDTAYIADMGGNVWRFKFCLKSEAEDPTSPCTQANWTGGLFYNATGNVRPIYTKPAVVWDEYGNVWVYFGTGDVTDPTASNAQERFHAVIDTARTGTFTYSNLKDVNGTTKVFNISEYTAGTYQGWSMDMPGMGIKILNDPIVFFGDVYFTTYEPSNSQNLCEKTGINYLYGLDYITGGAQFKDANNNPVTKLRIDDGPPGGAQGSIDNVTGDFVIFVGKKGYQPAGGSEHTRNNLLYWHDKRIN